jgi:uncharacterized protein (TIGR02996 family)
MDEENGFIQAILADPENEALRLIYADWLEERGDPRGDFLRLDCALRRMSKDEEDYAATEARWREMRAVFQPDWLKVLERPAIENCSISFTFRCPRQWGRLRQTADDQVRFCPSCHRNVFFCGTLEQARSQARLGHCIAIDPRVARSPGDLAPEGAETVEYIMGEISVGDEWQEEREHGRPEGSPFPSRPPRSFVGNVSYLVRSVLAKVGLVGRRGDFWARARPGHPVTVRRGTFEGLQGEIESLDMVGQRVRVRLPMFSGQLPVELDVNDLELSS